MAELDLQHMSREQKLKTMHAIWEDLATDEAALVSPTWHESALRDTEANVGSGIERTFDWEDAKDELRKRAQ